MNNPLTIYKEASWWKRSPEDHYEGPYDGDDPQDAISTVLESNRDFGQAQRRNQKGIAQALATEIINQEYRDEKSRYERMMDRFGSGDTETNSELAQRANVSGNRRSLLPGLGGLVAGGGLGYGASLMAKRPEFAPIGAGIGALLLGYGAGKYMKEKGRKAVLDEGPALMPRPSDRGLDRLKIIKRDIKNPYTPTYAKLIDRDVYYGDQSVQNPLHAFRRGPYRDSYHGQDPFDSQW